MKLSAFVAVSVPIVAISQVPAVAADANDTSAWLHESIASLSAKKPAAHTTKSIKRVAHAAPPVSLRPFKPGRYLPSERDLRQAMVAQQAQYDYSADQQQGMLAGQVSTAYTATPRAHTVYDQYAMQGGYGSAPPPVYAAPRVKPSKKAIGTRTPRVVPNQMPVMPEQLAQIPGMQPTGIAPLIPEPPVQRQVRAPIPVSMPMTPFPQPNARMMQQPMQQMQSMQQPNPMMQQQMMMQQQQQMMMQQQQMMGSPMAQQQHHQQPNFQPEGFSPAEMADLHRRVDINRPSARMNFNGDVIGQALDNPGSGIGQPPSPLNFLGGGGSMLQNLTHGQKKANVAPARFGSWHGGSGLQEAGFHSYVHRRKPMMYDYRTATPAAVAKRKPAAGKRTNFSAPPSVAQKSKPIVVATYPSYTSGRGNTY